MNKFYSNCKPPVYSNCRPPVDRNDDNELQVLVREYIEQRGNCYEIENRWWGDRTLTWEEAVARAWQSRLENAKMHSHQYRVANKLAEGLEVALADRMQPEDFTDFQSLYDWVKSIAGRVKGLGSITAYDVARRLGAWLKLEPVVVYLHGGTTTGAKKFGVEGEIAPLDGFPQEIQALGATHAENFLCIYKDRIPYGTNNA